MIRRNLFKPSAVRMQGLAWMLGAAAMSCGDAPDSADGDESRATRLARPLIERSFDEDAAAVAETFPAAWDLVRRFLLEERGLEGHSFAAVTTIQRPDVDGVAYLEFALRRETDDAGYVIVSTAAHDVPIVAWSDRGPAFAARLARLESRDQGARIFMTGPGAFVVERADGSPSSLDTPMTRESWVMAKEQFIRARAADKIESANRALRAWQRVAARNVLAAPDFTEELVRGADRLWPPNYPQFSGTFDNGSCKVGCVPNAFTQIAAWASHQAGDHRDGSVWGHPRMAYAFDGAEDLWAPSSFDSNLAAVATEFRRQLGTTCSGTQGMTSYFPYDRLSVLSGQLFNRIGAPVNTAGIYNASWDTYARVIDNHLFAHVPVEINAMTDPWGNSAHAWIVWGYRSDTFGEAYRVNMGWDSHEPGEWVSKDSVLSALTSGFTHGLDGSGIVVFSPQDLGRDHGPITMGAGSSDCLDVTDASADDGAYVSRYPCHGGDNQLWYLDRTDMSAPGWQIRNRKSGKCLAPSASQDAAVVQQICDTGDPNTFWRIEKRGVNVALTHSLSGRCLTHDADGVAAANEGKLLTSDCNDTTGQLFDFAR